MLHQATVTLNHDDILSLDAPFLLMAAPGSDRIILPQYVFIRLGPCPTPYAGYGEQIQISAGTNLMLASIRSVDLFGVSDPGEAVSGWALPRSIVDTTTFLGTAGTYDSDIRNKSVYLQVPAGAMSGGESGDTLTVSMSYLVFNIATGQFE